MSGLYIHHHLGLGDHFVCNGLVRMASLGREVPTLLAVKIPNFETVRSLYSDLPIDLDPVEDDVDAERHYYGKEVLRVGFDRCNSEKWESSFYEQVGVNYETRYLCAKINRDSSRECKLRSKISLPEKYIFCNKKCSHGEIPISLKTHLDLPIVYLERVTKNLLDWCSVIEKAQEIHTIDSAVFQLIKNMRLKQRRVFYDARILGVHRNPPTFENEDWEVVQ